MKRVLIVDDEEIARVSLAEILRLEGYQIKAVGSGEAAVEILKNEPFDVMILDLKMPGIGGMGVLKVVVKKLPDLQIIMLTAHGSLDTAIQAIRFRIHDYLLKPVTPEQIVESIERALAKNREEKAASSVPNIKEFPGGSSIDFSKRMIMWDGGRISLTPTESKLLGTLYEMNGQVITHSDLVLKCQGYRVNNEEAAKILRPVVSRLRQKMKDMPGWDEWIKNIRGAGYMLEFTTAQT
jgi:DNA-binding response OmpR family regulator